MGKIIQFPKSLADTHPELAAQWGHEKNGQLGLPEAPGPKVWWVCPEGLDHKWSTVRGRIHRASDTDDTGNTGDNNDE